MENLYHYQGVVSKVYDCDTITVDVDLGFHVSLKKETFRLFRINTPEVRGPEKEQGYVSRDWLRAKIKKVSMVDGLQMFGWMAVASTMNWLSRDWRNIRIINFKHVFDNVQKI